LFLASSLDLHLESTPVHLYTPRHRLRAPAQPRCRCLHKPAASGDRTWLHLYLPAAMAKLWLTLSSFKYLVYACFT
jgi:hypothetical protein